jgi:MFS family permease
VSKFQGWQQVAATMVMQAASSGSIFIAYSVIAVPLQTEFEPSRMMLMMAVTAALIGSGILSPMLGRTMERLSLRRLMMLGTTVLGVGFILVSRAQSMAQVQLIYLFLMATAGVLCGPIAGSALLARWFTKRRGLAMSLSAAGAALGGLVAPPLLQFLIETLEWRTALLCYGAGLTLLTFPVIGLFVINRPEDIGQNPDGADMPRERPTHQLENPGLSFYLKDRNFWFLGIVLGLLFASSMGITANLLQYVAERGMDAAMGALLLSIFAAANFAGKLLSGAMADRFNPKRVLTGIVVLFGLAVLSLGQFGVYWVFVVASIVLGISQGAIVPLWSIMMARLYGPDRVGSSMGMMSLILTPFNLVAAPSFGLVFDHTGSYVGAYLGCVVLLALSLVLVAMITEHQPG